MGSCYLKLLACLCLLLGIVAGCSKEELNKLASKAKDAVSDGREAVAKNVEAARKSVEDKTAETKEQLKMAGSIQLNAGTDIKTDACYASLLQQGASRPVVLQLRSYRDAESEEFPSVFVQAQVRANSVAELKGEPIEARMFVQFERNGKVLLSEAGKPVTLQITDVDESSLTAKLVEAALLDTGSGQSIAATGQFEGVLQ